MMQLLQPRKVQAFSVRGHLAAAARVSTATICHSKAELGGEVGRVKRHVA